MSIKTFGKYTEITESDTKEILSELQKGHVLTISLDGNYVIEEDSLGDIMVCTDNLSFDRNELIPRKVDVEILKSSISSNKRFTKLLSHYSDAPLFSPLLKKAVSLDELLSSNKIEGYNTLWVFVVDDLMLCYNELRKWQYKSYTEGLNGIYGHALGFTIKDNKVVFKFVQDTSIAQKCRGQAQHRKEFMEARQKEEEQNNLSKINEIEEKLSKKESFKIDSKIYSSETMDFLTKALSSGYNVGYSSSNEWLSYQQSEPMFSEYITLKKSLLQGFFRGSKNDTSTFRCYITEDEDLPSYCDVLRDPTNVNNENTKDLLGFIIDINSYLFRNNQAENPIFLNITEGKYSFIISKKDATAIEQK